MVASMPMRQFLSFTGLGIPDADLEHMIMLSRSEQPA
jgi:hypothetical protein